MLDDFLTTSTSARILDTSESGVRYLERTGKLQAVRTASGIRLFERSAVEQLRDERQRLKAQHQQQTVAA
jgi:DNA-binding transcriptional MerR regulator